jgi:hypothetical protein
MHPDTPQQFPIHARFDTLDFMLRFHLPKEMVAAFREANGLRFRTFGVNKYARCRGWQQGVTLQSPTRAAFELAAAIAPSDLLPVGLHPCLDNIQPDQESADELIDFYQKHAVQRSVRTMTVMCEETSYSARGNGRTRLVMYSTKLDKVTGQPCAHFELRLRGGAKLKRMGLGTIRHILDFDHDAFWEKNLVLIEPKFCTVQEVIDAVVARNRHKHRRGLWNGGSAEKRIASFIHRGRITSEDGDDQTPIVFPQESRKWERALLINGTRPTLIDKTPFMPTMAIDNAAAIINTAICHTRSKWQDFSDVKVLR